MATASGIRAGRAFVELFTDDSKLVRGLKSAEKKLHAWGESIRGLGTKIAAAGAAITAPLIASAHAFASAGDAMYEMSHRTGISVEALSGLKHAADSTGVGVEDLETGIRKMQKTIVAAAQGSVTAQEDLGALGLTIKDLDGLSPDEQFKLIADRISQIEDPTIRAAMAMQIFGRNGTALLPMMAAGAAGIEAFQARAQEMGLVISEQTAASAHKLNKALELTETMSASCAKAIGAALAPAMTATARYITELLVQAKKWIVNNQELIVTIFRWAGAIIAGGVAVVALGYAISGIGTVLGVLGTVISSVGSAFSVMGAVLAWLLNPIVLLSASIWALAGYMVYSSGAGGKALTWLGDRFVELKDEAMQAYQGIADALAAGDIGLAAKILWLTLKMEWTKGSNWISSIWRDCLLWLQQVGTEAFYGLVMGAKVIWHGLEVAWIETTAFLSGVWMNFCTGIYNAWMWVVKSLEETWNKIKGLFDSSFDANAANAAVEQKYQQAKDQMWNAAKQKIGEREAQRLREREESAASHEAGMAELGKRAENVKGRLQSEHDQKIAGNQKELEDARKEWKDAIEAAKDKRKAKEAAGPGKLKDPDELLDEAKKKLGGLGVLMEQATKKTIGVKGTFNAAAVVGLQAGGIEDRIAAAAERTAKGVEGLRQDVRNNKAEFD